MHIQEVIILLQEVTRQNQEVIKLQEVRKSLQTTKKLHTSKNKQLVSCPSSTTSPRQWIPPHQKASS
jgi:hypothetical protein